MKLHEDKILFAQLLNFATNSLNIRPEFIDIAVIYANSFTGNQLKMLIKRLAKDMAPFACYALPET